MSNYLTFVPVTISVDQFDDLLESNIKLVKSRVFELACCFVQSKRSLIVCLGRRGLIAQAPKGLQLFLPHIYIGTKKGVLVRSIFKMPKKSGFSRSLDLFLGPKKIDFVRTYFPGFSIVISVRTPLKAQSAAFSLASSRVWYVPM